MLFEDRRREAHDGRFTRPNAHCFLKPTARSFVPDVQGAWARRRRQAEVKQHARESEYWREGAAPRHAILELRFSLKAIKLALAMHRYALARKYSPDQPRIPAGQPGGGQWTSEGEAGTRYAQSGTQGRYSVDLLEEELAGGHAYKEHVGKSDMELIEVLNRRYYRGVVTFAYQDAQGSFSDTISANDFVNRVLKDNSEAVDQVVSGDEPKLIINQRFGYETGKEAFRPDLESEPYIRKTFGVRVVIEYDRNSARGFRVKTAFPVNQPWRR